MRHAGRAIRVPRVMVSHFQYSIRDAEYSSVQEDELVKLFNFQYSIRDAWRAPEKSAADRRRSFQYSIRDALPRRPRIRRLPAAFNTLLEMPNAAAITVYLYNSDQLFQYSIRDARLLPRALLRLSSSHLSILY